MTTYWRTHRDLDRDFGRAKTHLCVWCLGPAEQWALLHVSLEYSADLTGNEAGKPYAEPTLENYAPMCRGCHVKFDHPSAKVPRGGKTHSNSGYGLEKRRSEDPELAARLGAIRSRNGKISTAKINAPRRCNECPMVSTSAGVSKHQKASGHEGWVLV